MFNKCRVVRIDVDEPGTQMASGIGVGATEAEVMRAHPARIYVEPHKYDDRGHYLKYRPVDPTDRGFGLPFETDGYRF
jgi:hypothetical protein